MLNVSPEYGSSLYGPNIGVMCSYLLIPKEKLKY